MSVTVEQISQPGFGNLPSFMRRLFGSETDAPPVAALPANASRTSHTPYGLRSFVSAGQGPLTVIFESGLGDGKEVWNSVLQAVSAQTRVVAYDRAGYGQSERSTEQRDGVQIVEELRAMLQAENIPPPYVLVGHSLGGTFVKLFACLYPQEVAGVVLVDARHADFSRRCRQMGVMRLFYEPPLALFMLGRSAKRAEFQAAPLTQKQVRAAGPFPKVPLIVLTHRLKAIHWPRGLMRAWASSQRSLAGLSTLGRIKVCDDSGHYVHRDRPDLVVRAVLGVVAAARYRLSQSQRGSEIQSR
mgnify:CR=1 FL=1|jgi:pimeloyl-ACP methyl ester carboxylesterase